MGGFTQVTLVMVVVEFLERASSTLSKAAMTRGMSNFIFVLYKDFVGVLLLLPCSFLYYRKRSRAPLTLSIIWRVAIYSFIRCFAQIFMTLGIKMGSPTLASAISNVSHSFTFIFAIIFGMEKVDIRNQSSRAKVCGTILSMAGAFVITLYKGPPIAFAAPESSHNYSPLHHQHLRSAASAWSIGAVLLTLAHLSFSVMHILQTWIMRDYPEELMVMMMSCGFVTIQSAIICLIKERDPNIWRLQFDIMEFISVTYSALVMVALRGIAQLWSCRKMGPFFTSMFKPLGLVFTIALGVAFLGETLFLGRLLGAAVISLGVYCVIWGKAKERKAVGSSIGTCSSEPSSHETPLLQGKDDRV